MAKQKSITAAGGGKAKSAAKAEPPAKSERDAGAKKKRTNPFEFFQQVRAEGSKVTWTTRGETMVSTVMVLIMVAFAALFFFLVDQVLSFVVRTLLNLGG